MKTKLLGAVLAFGLATVPLASFAGGVGGGNANSHWTIYGWQNWESNWHEVDSASIDPADVDDTRSRDFHRIDNGAANIGFAATIDSGMSLGDTPIKVNFQCEQFTYFNRFSDFAFNDWCSRNSKLGISGIWGEVMYSAWLTPYNEITAQWIDPFYDAGTQTHATLLGLSGFGSSYGNGGFDSAFGNGMANIGFMRRKPELYQWFSPNWGGFNMRVAYSSSHNSDFAAGETQITDSNSIVQEVDPSMLSIGAAYTHTMESGDELWFGFGYQKHDEWAAVDFACSDSDDDTFRYAARYIHNWGDSGHATTVAGAFEQMSWEWDECGAAGNSAGPFAIAATTNASIDVERDAWLFSGKHNFPGPFDFRWMYQEADDYDCKNISRNAGKSCGGIDESSSGAEALSLGIFYTLPAGTELRLVYGEVDNDRNSQNDYGINSTGVVQGGEIETYQFGVVQWF